MTFGHEEALQLCCATEACWLHLELVILYSKNGTHLKIKKDEVGVKRKSDPPTEKYEAWIYFLIFLSIFCGENVHIHKLVECDISHNMDMFLLLGFLVFICFIFCFFLFSNLF